jgi:tRNA(Ile)-lysidine synthase
VGQPVLRFRQSGDKITLKSRCTKSLKKLFIEEKIPVWERENRLVLADEQGVLWVEGIGCDMRALPCETTRRILEIKGV